MKIWKGVVHKNIQNHYCDIPLSLSMSGAESWLRNDYTHTTTTTTVWTFGQIRKTAGCVCAGNAANVFLSTTVLLSRHASRHVRGTRAWYVPGSLTSGFLWSWRQGKRTWYEANGAVSSVIILNHKEDIFRLIFRILAMDVNRRFSKKICHYTHGIMITLSIQYDPARRLFTTQTHAFLLSTFLNQHVCCIYLNGFW